MIARLVPDRTDLPAPPMGAVECFDAFRPGLPPPSSGALLVFLSLPASLRPLHRLILLESLEGISLEEDLLTVRAAYRSLLMRSPVDGGPFSAIDEPSSDMLSLQRPTGLSWSIFFPEPSIPSIPGFLERSLMMNSGLAPESISSIMERVYGFLSTENP